LRDIAQTPWWPKLRALTLSSFTLDADDVSAIVRRAPHLVELQLISSRCGVAGLDALARASVARRLEILALRHANLAPRELSTVLDATRFSSVAALDLRTNAIDATDIAAVARLPALRVLNLASTKLDDAAAQALAASRLELRALDVRTNPLGACAKA